MGHGTWDGTWDMDMGLPWYGTQIATGCKLRSSITHPNPEPRTVKTQPTPAQTTKHPPHHPCCESSLVAFAVRVQCPPLGKPWFNLELKANHRWAPNLLKSDRPLTSTTPGCYTPRGGYYSTRTANATSEDSQQGWCGVCLCGLGKGWLCRA